MRVRMKIEWVIRIVAADASTHITGRYLLYCTVVPWAEK